MKFEITDDSGFLAIVNNENYNSFVKEKWELYELFDHLLYQMNEGNMSIWRTSNEGGGFWCVNFVKEKSEKNSIREFTSTMNITNGRVYLSNYEDLTMCASYPKYKIPLKHNSQLFYELENGLYEITVRQFLNPNIEVEIDLHFEIVCKPTNEKSNNTKIEKIVWYE